MSVIGSKEFEKALKSLSELNVKDEIEYATNVVRDFAVDGAPLRAHGSGGGGLRNSIYEDFQQEGDTYRGIVYTNLSYAPFVEFGTGPVGQENHEGVAPDVAYTYGQTGWKIPVSADMTPDTAERYGLGIIKNKDEEVIGYATNGQPAHPFMYPALKDNEDTILKKFKTQFKVKIEKKTR